MMSALLPLFASPQNGLNAIGVSDSGLEPLIQESPDQTLRSGEASSPVFSQVLRHQYAKSTFPTHLETLASPSSQENISLPPLSPQGAVRNPEIISPSESIQEFFSESQASTIQPSLPTFLPTDSVALPDTTSLRPSHVSTNKATPGFSQNIVIAQGSSPVFHPTVPLTLPIDTQVSVNGVLPARTLSKADRGPTLAQGRQAFEIDGHVSKNPHISLPSVLQSTSVSQQISQGTEAKAISSELNQDEAFQSRTHVPLVKDVLNRLSPIRRVSPVAEVIKAPSLPRLNASTDSPILRPSDVLPVTALQQDGPVGFTKTGPTNPLELKPIFSVSSVLNDGSSPTIGNRTTVQVDPLGDRGLLSKGDRVSPMVEASIKQVGVDSSGGQELGSGMNHSPHSQARFQEPSSSLGQGMGVRGVERGPEFPTPVLQRLQMDVQISDSHRVSIDVGVQNRLVSAGLVMDHSVLRNLATQFVPQLENQLNQVDLELQEFSAEVREEREQETLFDGAGPHDTQQLRRDSTSESHSTHKTFVPLGEQGLHLVA